MNPKAEFKIRRLHRLRRLEEGLDAKLTIVVGLLFRVHSCAFAIGPAFKSLKICVIGNFTPEDFGAADF